MSTVPFFMSDVKVKMVTVMQFYLKWCIVHILHSTRGLLNFWLSIDFIYCKSG